MAFDPPIIDNFTGSNGSIDNRVSSAGPVWAAPWTSGDVAASIASNAIASVSAGSDYQGVIDSQTYGPDIEAGFVISQIGSGTIAQIYILTTSYAPFPATFGTGDAYRFYFLPGGGGAPPIQVLLSRYAGVTETVLIDQASTLSNMIAGQAIGLSLVEEGSGTRCRLYRKISGVWTEEANTLDTDASRPTGQRYLVFDIRHDGSTPIIIDDFMGQTVSTTVSPLKGIAALGWLSR